MARTTITKAIGERGQALIMVTLGITFLLGILGLVVDVGYGYFLKQCAQAAADSAALAAASYLANNAVQIDGTVTANCPATPSYSTYTGVACLYAQANGFANYGNQTVAVTSGTGEAPVGASTTYWVTVTTSQQLPVGFLQVLGGSNMTAMASASAGVLSGGCQHSGLNSMQSTLNMAVLGLANSTINNSNVTITGNEAIYTGGSLSNGAPSTVTGNIYEATSGQCPGSCGPGKIGGSLIVDPTSLQTMVNTALANATKAASFTPTQTFSRGISTPTTITGNGSTNVILINGNITNSVTLTGTSNDVFIVNVTGTVSLTGSTALGVGGDVTADHVLYNFTGSSGTISAGVGNSLYGTLLAPKYSFNVDGKWYGEIVSAGTIGLLSGASGVIHKYRYNQIVFVQRYGRGWLLRYSMPCLRFSAMASVVFRSVLYRAVFSSTRNQGSIKLSQEAFVGVQ